MRAKHGISRVLHAYADFRIGANEAEKRCHKQSDSILLTFDDYGTESEIDDILAILAAKQVKAMVFLTGNWAEANQELTQKIRAAGHVIGNHTYNHPNLLQLPDAAVIREIQKGVPGQWLRAPQGRANRRIRRLAGSLGFSLCYWTIDSRDWTGADAATMRHTILTELHPGAVVLFHLHGTHTRELLPGLIDDIRAQGFVLTDMNEAW